MIEVKMAHRNVLNLFKQKYFIICALVTKEVV